MLTLYQDGRQIGFAKATKTSGPAKVYWRRLNSKSGPLKVSILKDSKNSVGERSEPKCSCQSRFVGYICIGRNFEISLRQRGIVTECVCIVHKNKQSAHTQIISW